MPTESPTTNVPGTAALAVFLPKMRVPLKSEVGPVYVFMVVLPRTSVPAPVLRSAPAPLMAPFMVVVEVEMVSISRLLPPLLMEPLKVRLPVAKTAPDCQCWGESRAMGAVMIWVLSSLLKIPVPVREIVLPPMTKLPAPLLKKRLEMLKGTLTLGKRRVIPAKARSAVPSLGGAISVDQLIASVKLLEVVLPPSQVKDAASDRWMAASAARMAALRTIARRFDLF